jgi:peptidoglycan/xylan/chitin deacetylase (PgdA/CDA1 family)
VAISFHLVLEEWAGPQADAAAVAPAFPRELLEAGQTDWARKSWQDYGGRTGFYRLMDVLNEYGIKGSASISALAAEVWPEPVREFVSAGHEPVAHAYSQERRMFRMTPDEEHADIRQCVEILSGLTGVRPVGWGSPGGQRSDLTPALLLQEGFLYLQDFRDADVPYIALEQDGRRLVALPSTFEVNDVMLFARHGNPPSAYVEMFCRSLDRLYKEGEYAPKLLTAVCHSTLLGRPFGGWVLEECIRYARRFSRVWIARRRDLAQWFLDHASERV